MSPAFTIKNGVLSLGAKRVRLDHVSSWERGTNHIIITCHGKMETIPTGNDTEAVMAAIDEHFANPEIRVLPTM